MSSGSQRSSKRGYGGVLALFRNVEMTFLGQGRTSSPLCSILERREGVFNTVQHVPDMDNFLLGDDDVMLSCVSSLVRRRGGMMQYGY